MGVAQRSAWSMLLAQPWAVGVLPRPRRRTAREAAEERKEPPSLAWPERRCMALDAVRDKEDARLEEEHCCVCAGGVYAGRVSASFCDAAARASTALLLQ